MWHGRHDRDRAGQQITRDLYRIVIAGLRTALGAGYAGLMAAIRLAGKNKRRPVKVTLINANDHLVERPRLHETATGNGPQPKPLADLIAGTGITFEQGCVTAFDPERQQVTIETGGRRESAPYDYRQIRAFHIIGNPDKLRHL